MREETVKGLPVLSFDDAAEFSSWIGRQPAGAPGAWIRLGKKGGAPMLRKPDAIDVALCHGWIDGQQLPYDEASWLTRFTPRRRGSRWSQVNRQRAEELDAAGLIQPGGAAEIAAAKADGRWDAAYPPASAVETAPDLEAALARAPAAAAAFAQLGRSQRYSIHYRLATLKRASSRPRAIEAIIASLLAGASKD